MTSSIGTVTLVFVGPTEIMLVAVVALVILFGSRAPELAQRAGEAIGNFETSRKEVEKEVNEVTSEVTDEVEDVRDEVGLDEDIEAIREDIQTINKDLEATTGASNAEATPPEKATEEETSAN